MLKAGTTHRSHRIYLRKYVQKCLERSTLRKYFIFETVKLPIVLYILYLQTLYYTWSYTVLGEKKEKDGKH